MKVSASLDHHWDGNAPQALHTALSGQNFDLADLNWKCILAQEAGITVSTLPQTQQDLTPSLSLELAPSPPEKTAV